MARIIPSDWRNVEAIGAAQREIETLARLQKALPDAYTVYHGVHWTRVGERFSMFGEIDFVVVNPVGAMLLIEQKSGFLQETPEGLVKSYGEKQKKVAVQMARTADALRAKFCAVHRDVSPHIELLLYCPDYTVKQPAIAGLDPARIVDAKRRDAFTKTVQEILPADAPVSPLAAQVHRFLSDQLQLVADVSALIGRAEAMVTRLSGGLADWARRLEFQPFRLRVIGTAGSGKTQLALGVYRDAVAAGKRPLYVCFNRPLADHVAALVPEGGVAATYHQLCDRYFRSRGGVPDFADPECFPRLEEALASGPADEQWRFDVLIVDEGQDFSESWRDALLGLLREDGHAWWLEDPLQNLYGREPVRLPDWVTLHSNVNYRSPRDVLGYVNRLLDGGAAVEAGSPFMGSDVQISTYADATGLIDETKRAITRCVGMGYTRGDIALVSFRGRERSRLMSYTQLGPHTLKTFTGKYDLLGDPVYTEGELLLETVYRFKGQSAPCVVLTEVDFENFDELARRKLFVGATRARMHLTLIVSEAAAAQLIKVVG
ncbi:MAG: ATP-binding domain-containing protein [Burkholderiales bacterium]